MCWTVFLQIRDLIGSESNIKGTFDLHTFKINVIEHFKLIVIS